MKKDNFNLIVEELWDSKIDIPIDDILHHRSIDEQFFHIAIETSLLIDPITDKEKSMRIFKDFRKHIVMCMTTLEFLYDKTCLENKMIFRTLLRDRSIETLIKKAAEYATDEDRLYNFKRASEMINREPETVLIGMASKHFVSVEDIIKEPKRFNYDQILEKFGDAVNYLILLYALIKDRENES